MSADLPPDLPVTRDQLDEAVIAAAFAELGHAYATTAASATSPGQPKPAKRSMRRKLGIVHWAARRTLRKRPSLHRLPATFRRELRVKSGSAAQAQRHAASKGKVAASRLAELTAHSQHDRAVALAIAAFPGLQHDATFVSQATRSFYKAGEISLALATNNALRAVDSSAGPVAREADLTGRIRETTPGWLPLLPGPPEPIQDPVPGRILHLLKESVPYHQNGFTMRSMYTLRAQLEAGLEPIVLTSLGFPRVNGVDEFPAEEIIEEVRHIRLDLGAAYDLKTPHDRYLTDFAWTASRNVRELAPSVIHVGSGHRGYETALVGLALGRHFGIPVVYEVRSFFETTWTGDAARAEQGEYYRRRYDTENRCMAAADAVITISESMRAEIVARGVPAERVSVAPNGVDSRRFSPRERSAELVDRYGLRDRFIFGYVSNLDHPREGQEFLIEAAAILRERGVPATALIIGDGKRRTELEALAAGNESVIFTGRVDHSEVLDHYALLSVFVVPRTRDRAARLVTPLKPFEAMASGIPLVVSDLEALREIIGDGDRGWMFPPGDATALADLLQQLSTDPDALKHTADRALTWVNDCRQWTDNGPLYEAVYKDVLARRASVG